MHLLKILYQRNLFLKSINIKHMTTIVRELLMNRAENKSPK